MSKFLNISTDNTLGGSSASDDTVSSQKAVKEYVDSHGGGSADTDLSNLTSQGQNIANWSTNVTNCITEIPQDIKQELNNGTLILKAGSKVYFPNGSGTFDSFILPSDFDSGDASGITKDYMFFINSAKKGIAGTPVSNCYSGETEPVNPSTGTIWYDTTNNSVKRWSGSAWVGGFSLPFVTLSAGAVLKQVFNGFGYIGSTVFALPGVKGLIPNGRNADGTLKNIEFETSRVITNTTNNTFTDFPVILKNDNTMYSLSGFLVEDRPSRTPTVGRWFSYYSPLDNKIYQSDNGNPWLQQMGYIVGIETSNGTRVTSLTSKTAFHALDYNDSSTISGWAMPSSRYIDLTLGASGSTYTAPANGWVFYAKASGSSGQFNSITNSTSGGLRSDCDSSNSARWATVNCPVKKGDIFSVEYTTSGETKIFRFIYAEGEN